MKRRHGIQLSPDEQRDFLKTAKTIVLSTIDHHGYPHSVAMWFVVDDDGAVLMTTYAKSQKTLNIHRNPKVALLVESGETYETLKGVLVRGEAEVLTDLDMRLAVIRKVHRKMTGAFPEGVEEALERQAAKRLVIKVMPQMTSSWDHSKLGGNY